MTSPAIFSKGEDKAEDQVRYKTKIARQISGGPKTPKNTNMGLKGAGNER